MWFHLRVLNAFLSLSAAHCSLHANEYNFYMYLSINSTDLDKISVDFSFQGQPVCYSRPIFFRFQTVWLDKLHIKYFFFFRSHLFSLAKLLLLLMFIFMSIMPLIPADSSAYWMSEVEVAKNESESYEGTTHMVEKCWKVIFKKIVLKNRLNSKKTFQWLFNSNFQR